MYGDGYTGNLTFRLFCFARSKIMGYLRFVAPFVLKKLLDERYPALNPVKYGDLRRIVEFAGKRLRKKQLPIHLESHFNLRFDLRHCTENLFVSILLIIL